MRVVSDHRVCVVDEYVAPVEVAASVVDSLVAACVHWPGNITFPQL